MLGRLRQARKASESRRRNPGGVVVGLYCTSARLREFLLAAPCRQIRTEVMALNSSIPAQHQTTRKKQCEIIRRILLVAVVMSQGGSPRSIVNGSRWQDSASAHQSCHPARAKGDLISIIRSSSITIGRGYHNASNAPPQGCVPYISYQSPTDTPLEGFLLSLHGLAPFCMVSLHYSKSGQLVAFRCFHRMIHQEIAGTLNTTYIHWLRSNLA
jgi:hypothetical protein